MIQLRFWDYTMFEQATQNAQDERARLEAAVMTRRPAAPRAPVYYLLSAALSLVQHQDIVLQLYWARLWSILVNVGVVCLAILVGRVLFYNDPFGRWMVPLLVVFHPQHTFIMSGINDGSIAELFASAAVLAMIAFIFRELRWRWLIFAAVFTGLATAAKPPAAFLVPVLGGIVVLYGWRRLPTLWRWISVVFGLTVIAVVVLTAPRVSNEIRLLETYLNQKGWDAFLVSVLPDASSRGFLWAFRSWWATLGWESLPATDEWVWALLALTGIAGIGWVKFAWYYLNNKVKNREDTLIWQAFWMFALMLVILGLLVAFKGVLEDKDVFLGRYFFVAISPTVGLLVMGWRALIPVSWRHEALAAFTVFLFLFDTAVLLTHVLPFFYPLWR
ncbi:MAG: hypothetical protein RMK79_03930 [Anaerolineae bacterium]|nr:hypothetical protein [Anaerolineae bacterium]